MLRINVRCAYPMTLIRSIYYYQPIYFIGYTKQKINQVALPLPFCILRKRAENRVIHFKAFEHVN